MEQQHGISVGIERIDDDIFFRLKATGTLTHEDYEQFIPMFETAVGSAKHPRLRILFDVTEFEGWDLHAVWDDMKFGLQHGSEFEKIAIYGHSDWMDRAAKIGNWFIHGEVEYFEDFQQALHWISQ